MTTSMRGRVRLAEHFINLSTRNHVNFTDHRAEIHEHSKSNRLVPSFKVQQRTAMVWVSQVTHDNLNEDT